MKRNITVAVLAMLGVFGPGRWAGGQDPSSATGMSSATERLPPIDVKVPSKTETATFALG
jgi:hypothetical protein